LKELKSGDKIVQQMTRDGAMEVNKATGGAANISARDTEATPARNAQNPGDDSTHIFGGAVGRVQSERQAAKKRKARKANAEIYEGYQQKPETSRLQFTDAERTDPAMTKPVRKSDKAAKRYEKTRAKVPKEKSLTIERVSDKPSGKAETRLVFQDRDKPPNGKLTHALDRPKREAANFVHGKVSQVEGDNTGVQAAHTTEKAAEYGARKVGEGYRRLKLQPHRAALRAEEKAIKANSKALYERSLRRNPELRKANPLKKALHKRRIKREYAKAFRQGNQGVQQAAGTAKKATRRVGSAVIRTIKSIKVKKTLFLFGVLLLMLMLIMTGVSSCIAMFGGGFNTLIGTSYTAEDADILGAHGNYVALENALENRINNIHNEFPGYDEYRFNLDAIGHDPHALISYLTARFHAFTMDDPEVQAAIAALFARQYTLTITPIVEVRTRTETRTGTDADGNTYTYTVTVQYNWYVLEVTLVNRTMPTAALENLTPEQVEMWHVYMETRGNRPDLFGGSPNAQHYEIPPEALADDNFAAMIAVAERYLGYPYVWGGSNPATGFDCSGFVWWVITQSGLGSIGRTTANGLLNHTTIIPAYEARPGDLVFFQGTYNTRGASHVGIYVGDGMMIHAGSPVSYASIRTPYWTQHFLVFGRLPET